MPVIAPTLVPEDAGESLHPHREHDPLAHGLVPAGGP